MSTVDSESSNVSRRAGIVGVGTLLSRVLGAVRDSVIAAHFPLVMTDAFSVTFMIPNALRSILGEGAVASAFVPVFSEVRDKEGMARAQSFYQNLSGVFIAILALVTLLGIIAAPYLVLVYAFGYRSDPARMQTAVELTPLFFPYIFFMGIAALGMGALNAMKRFVAPAFAPALLNVAMIGAVFTLGPLCDHYGISKIGVLAFGALAGGVFQVLAQWPSLKRVGLLNMPRFGLSDPYVRKALRLLGPVAIGTGVYQINLILSRQLGSFLPTGAQSYNYYASRIVDLPQGVFALAIGTAALPSLASLYQRGAHDEVKTLVRNALGVSLFVAMPASLLLIALAEPTVVVLFARGQFDHSVVVPTAHQLILQASAIWTVATIRMFVPVFYAYNDTKSPVIASTLNLAVNACVAVPLLGTLGHLAIPLGSTVATLVQLVVLAVLLRNRIGAYGIKAIVANTSKIVVISVAAAAVAWFIAQAGHWQLGGNNLRNLAVYAAALICAVIVYFAGARLLRCAELETVLAAVTRKRAASRS